MDRRTFMGLAGSAMLGFSQQTLAATEPEREKKESARHLLIRFLGTGAADWKGPDERGEHRRLSSILVDNRVLIDYTSTARDMIPQGINPEIIFYTHSHGDHFNAQAALSLGIRQVYLSQTWYDIAVQEFRRASLKTEVPMPEITPLVIGQKVTLGDLVFQALPANHATNNLFEQSLIYLIKRGQARVLYATDTGGIPATAARMAGIDAHVPGEPITGLIMEATMGMDHEVDFREYTHSSVASVRRIAEVLTSTKRYTPQPGQHVFLTHMARTLHGTQAELDAQLPPPLRAAYDGLEVEFSIW